MKLWHTLAGVSVRTGLVELEGSVAMEDKLTMNVGRVYNMYELASGFLPKAGKRVGMVLRMRCALLTPHFYCPVLAP